MKKIIFIILISIIVILLLPTNYFILHSIVEATGDLSIDFGLSHGDGTVFHIENMSPGQSISKDIIIHNDASTDRSFIIRGVLRKETGNFSNALTITMRYKGADLYGGKTGMKTLNQFFRESIGMQQITIPGQQSRTYTLIVQFPSSAGNEFQSKQLNFDLHIELTLQLPPQCQHMYITSKPIYGTSRHDTLVGTNGNDLIIGLEGNDVIDGKGGDDCIIGSEGHDVLIGGNGNDILIGGKGQDIAIGGQGADICEGELKLSCEH